LRFNHCQRKTDAKAISLPEIFRKTSHRPAGRDPSEGLSTTTPEKAPRNPSSHLPPLKRCPDTGWLCRERGAAGPASLPAWVAAQELDATTPSLCCGGANAPLA